VSTGQNRMCRTPDVRQRERHRHRRHRLGPGRRCLAVLIVLVGGCLVAGCADSADLHPGPDLVTAPYEASVRLRSGHWQIADTLVIDAAALAELAPYLDEHLARELELRYERAELAADPGSADRDPGTGAAYGTGRLLTVLRARHRTGGHPTSTTTLQLLDIGADELRCLAEECPQTALVLRGVYRASVVRILREQGWRTPVMVDGALSFFRERRQPAQTPGLGWQTQHLSLPRVAVGADAVIVPRAQSRVMVVAPKGMVASTYPAESGRVDRLSGGEEEVVMDVDGVRLTGIRVAVLDSMLRSPQGHWLYRLGSWPFLPLTLGVAAVLVLAAVPERVRKVVPRWLPPLPEPAGPEPSHRIRAPILRGGFRRRSRDIRVALTVGYLWLADSWLLVSSGSSGTGSSNGVLETVSDLTRPLGWPGQLALVSVAAFAVGSLIKVNPQRLGDFGGRPRPAAREIPGRADRLPDRTRARLDDCHRRHAEATLRLNIAVPLGLLLFLTTWQPTSGLWQRVLASAVSVACVVVLVWQAVGRVAASNDVMVRDQATAGGPGDEQSTSAAPGVAHGAGVEPGSTPANPRAGSGRS